MQTETAVERFPARSPFNPMRVEKVRVADLPRIWPLAAPFVEQALEQSAGEASLESIRRRIEDQALSLRVGYRDGEVAAAFVVSHVLYDNFSAVRVILAAGEPMKDWLGPLVQDLEDFCTFIGAGQIELFGRPGFARSLRGWADHQYTVMVRKVPNVWGK